jgi:hypothetical protein
LLRVYWFQVACTFILFICSGFSLLFCFLFEILNVEYDVQKMRTFAHVMMRIVLLNFVFFHYWIWRKIWGMFDEVRKGEKNMKKYKKSKIVITM